MGRRDREENDFQMIQQPIFLPIHYLQLSMGFGNASQR
jgi:hypothetical protein